MGFNSAFKGLKFIEIGVILLQRYAAVITFKKRVRKMIIELN